MLEATKGSIANNKKKGEGRNDNEKVGCVYALIMRK